MSNPIRLCPNRNGNLLGQEMQNIMKGVVRKSMLDKEYRELCLIDSQGHISSAWQGYKLTDSLFSEENQQEIPRDGWVYILNHPITVNKPGVEVVTEALAVPLFIVEEHHEAFLFGIGYFKGL